MGYYLGVDIGTTYTAAAVWRDGRCDVASLGNRAPTIPSVVYMRDDGTVLVGEAAVRRASTDPAGVAREFKRRVGDPTPVIVGGTPYSADALMSRLLRAVVEQVAGVEGAPPERIAVTHPANWGPYKLDLLRQATRLADLDDVVMVSEPAAAAIHYASQARVEPGAVIAVYDLGGGTFDAAVLRKTATGWDVLGTPEGIERLGGVDFDAAVLHHVTASIGSALDDLSPDDPAALAAVARLRQECVDAKEALSADSDVSIPVLLPSLQTEVRLTRAEYEQMARPALADTITSLTRALRSAKVEPADVTTVLLVGGSSRTPLVAELVSSALGRPVAVDAHPKYGVALGAAITAAMSGGKLSAADNTSVRVPPGEIPAPPGQTALAEPGPASPVGAAGAAAVARAAGAVGAVGGAVGAANGAPTRGGTSGAPSAAATAAGVSAVHAEAPPADLPTADARAASVFSDAPVTRRAPTADRTGQRSGGFPAGTRPASGGGERGRDTRSVMVPYGGEQGPPGGSDVRTTSGEVPLAPRRSSDGGTRSLLIPALAAVAVLLAAAVGFIALRGDDDPSGGDAATAGSGDEVAPTTTAAPTTTTPPVPPGPFVQLQSAAIEGGELRVQYQVFELEPSFTDLHVHLFLDTTPRDNAGENGDPVGRYFATEEPVSAVADFTPGEIAAATEVCAAVAEHEHGIIQQGEEPTGNCIALPR